MEVVIMKAGFFWEYFEKTLFVVVLRTRSSAML